MQQSTKTENHRKTYGFKRKEGDSNPRFPLGEYTLSRRASSATRAPFLHLSSKTLLNTESNNTMINIASQFGLQNYRFSGKIP